MSTLYEKIVSAQKKLLGIALHTPILRNENLSSLYTADIWLKREDLQPVRSYKLRGAYHKIVSLHTREQRAGVVCASAGNHAQGVAFACYQLGIKGRIVMPVTTPLQKIKQTRFFGKENVEIVLWGDSFDDAYAHALKISEEEQLVFIHPFDDEEVIAGQGTVGLEILSDTDKSIDYLFVPIGGGGLAAGLCTVFHQLSPETKIIGVEPAGASSMKTSINNGYNTTLRQIDKFVDGAAVKRVGELTFPICRELLHDIVTVAEGKICTEMLRLYNEDAIVAEPAGTLAIAALDEYAQEIKGKNVVCILSGGNNDITRMEEIKERSLLYEGLKHYFIVNFPQRSGALKELVNSVLGVNDDIVYFQYVKKNNRETGPAIIGIELKAKEDVPHLEHRLSQMGFSYQYLNKDPVLFTMLVG